MPDIAMCKGEGCSVARNCYRHRAVPNELWQSYFMDSPGKDENCRYFDHVQKGDRLMPEVIDITISSEKGKSDGTTALEKM